MIHGILKHVKRLPCRALRFVLNMGWRGRIAAGLFLFAVVSVAAIEVTAQPGFCNSCHVMNDYYHSWQTSGHSEVNCLDCHLQPGFTGYVKGKINGLAQAIDCAVGRFGTKPNATIVDASCLRSECHATEKLLTETLDYEGVRFHPQESSPCGRRGDPGRLRNVPQSFRGAGAFLREQRRLFHLPLPWRQGGGRPACSYRLPGLSRSAGTDRSPGVRQDRPQGIRVLRGQLRGFLPPAGDETEEPGRGDGVPGLPQFPQGGRRQQRGTAREPHRGGAQGGMFRVPWQGAARPDARRIGLRHDGLHELPQQHAPGPARDLQHRVPCPGCAAALRNEAARRG